MNIKDNYAQDPELASAFTEDVDRSRDQKIAEHAAVRS